MSKSMSIDEIIKKLIIIPADSSDCEKRYEIIPPESWTKEEKDERITQYINHMKILHEQKVWEHQIGAYRYN